MSLFGEQPPRTRHHQRVDNALEGFRTAIKEYRLKDSVIPKARSYPEMLAAVPQIARIAARADEIFAQLSIEEKKRLGDWWSVDRGSVEAMTAYCEELEERANQVKTERLTFNMVMIALHEWADGEEESRSSARNRVRAAYLKLFPEERPQQDGPKGRFSLMARALSARPTSTDFTRHLTLEAAVAHAVSIAAARGTTLEDWAQFIHPDGMIVVRTEDDDGFSYRISEERRPGPDATQAPDEPKPSLEEIQRAFVQRMKEFSTETAGLTTDEIMEKVGLKIVPGLPAESDEPLN